jgi:hypothetical protein
MKKIPQTDMDTVGDLSAQEKQDRENVWCAKYGYFIDLDACRSRARQQKSCRRCYASLIQTSLPF